MRKKSKTIIKYHKSVPQEIIDLMGDKSYRYIWHYNTHSWRNVTTASAPTPPPTQIAINVFEGDLEGTLEEAILKLQSYINNPDYVAGRLYVDYINYEYYLVCEITQNYTPSKKEIETYNQAKSIYDEELEIFKKLKQIVDAKVKSEKLLEKENKIKVLEKQLVKLKNNITQKKQ